ncbi:uncharacterized protein LDX57_002339 [Aspergillus melleus]|uniref:uncharacterized protein n=1 Tax=Aspergillus melleus TaxID=138277 RepID=UPI001E8E0742|nr:uncharacterized protein LDX57_002339 [Aspergillus melleus]KAH8424593.1 hypothetical protein LDX57_002339 [Aspergillus melleus]
MVNRSSLVKSRVEVAVEGRWRLSHLGILRASTAFDSLSSSFINHPTLVSGHNMTLNSLQSGRSLRAPSLRVSSKSNRGRPHLRRPHAPAKRRLGGRLPA